MVSMFGHKTLIASEGAYEAIMEWTGEDSFQLSVQGMAVPCYTLHSGRVGARVYFQRSGSKVISLSLPGLAYGAVYEKQS